MFKEIAVEPAAVATSYRDFSYIVEKFGISEGRLIAAFPGRWKALVHQAASQRLKGTVELSRIQERLRRLSNSVLLSRGRPGDGCEKDWIQAAIDEHRRLPFSAIITSTPREDQDVVAARDLDGEHPCLQSNRQWHVRRTADAMAACCEPLLSAGRQIKLVDPHFDAGVPRFRGPFLAFLDRRRPGANVDVYRGDNCDAAHIAERIHRSVSGIEGRGGTLRLFLMPQGAMHNRFLLNESGGVSFQIGLDEDFSNERPSDLVTVLETGPWQAEWDTYNGDSCVAQFSI